MFGRPWIVCKSRLSVKNVLYREIKFKKGESVDVSYLKINDILEYNLPYVESDFICNPGLMDKLMNSILLDF